MSAFFFVRLCINKTERTFPLKQTKPALKKRKKLHKYLFFGHAPPLILLFFSLQNKGFGDYFGRFGSPAKQFILFYFITIKIQNERKKV